MKCRLYTHILSVKCQVVLTFELDVVLVGFLEITCRIPSMSFTVMNWTKVSFYPSSYYTNSSIQQRKAGCAWLWFLLLSRVSWDQRSCESPQSMTKRMDIKGLHSAGGHCYLQYYELYSASFEITNWLDYLITIILLFKYDVDERISTDNNQYASTGWAVWFRTTPRWQCGSIR